MRKESSRKREKEQRRKRRQKKAKKDARRRARPASRRGNRSELRVFDALNALDIDWILGWRRATPEEDALGIDFIVTVPEGELMLQIKSSYYGKLEFLRREDSAQFAVVVVYDNDKIADIQHKLTGSLGQQRSWWSEQGLTPKLKSVGA
jgi:hypothetical protein